jgi:hypothetical protein
MASGTALNLIWPPPALGETVTTPFSDFTSHPAGTVNSILPSVNLYVLASVCSDEAADGVARGVAAEALALFGVAAQAHIPAIKRAQVVNESNLLFMSYSPLIGIRRECRPSRRMVGGGAATSR